MKNNVLSWIKRHFGKTQSTASFGRWILWSRKRWRHTNYVIVIIEAKIANITAPPNAETPMNKMIKIPPFSTHRSRLSSLCGCDIASSSQICKRIMIWTWGHRRDPKKPRSQGRSRLAKGLPIIVCMAKLNLASPKREPIISISKFLYASLFPMLWCCW